MVTSSIGTDSQRWPSGAAEPTRDDQEWLATQAAAAPVVEPEPEPTPEPKGRKK